MGLYDNYDPEQSEKVGFVFLIFLMILCLLMVGANLFVGAGIAWQWVFAPIWVPIVLGFIFMICGFTPSGK